DDRAHQKTRREGEERDRTGQSRRVEALEREKDEDELDHRRRGAREQHAADQTRETRYLEELPVARRRLRGDRYFCFSVCARSPPSRRPSPIQTSCQRPSR